MKKTNLKTTILRFPIPASSYPFIVRQFMTSVLDLARIADGNLSRIFLN